ncbi:MAG TPA: hypothetical protein VLF67_00410 [Candidatus Saccharimonas sp.]|nr:hypothetical protein [Candidatus Saccharimonas sp.]
MSTDGTLWQERRLEEILFSEADPLTKVQQIIHMGYDPEVADELVERHLAGGGASVYYETLEFQSEYDDSDISYDHDPEA